MNDRSVMIPVSQGELWDKITILRIKAEEIYDPAKLANVKSELAELEHIAATTSSRELDNLVGQLLQVNRQLWHVEDDIRICERNRDFGPQFVDLARSVYRLNDRRAAIKRKISLLLGSNLVEEKHYAVYD